MAYLPRAERRAAIIAAALRVIRADGFAAVSARSVAEAVGGSPGLIHQHFPSVVELTAEAWRAYVAENLAEFEGVVGGGGDPVDEFFANHLDPDRGDELGIWADAWAHAMRTPAFGVVFTESVRELTAVLRGSGVEMSDVEADRAVLLAIALGGMQRVAPGAYPVARVAGILGR